MYEKKKKNDRATMTKNVRDASHKMREQDYFMHENIIVFHQKKIFFPAERQIEIISPESQFFCSFLGWVWVLLFSQRSRAYRYISQKNCM